MVASSAEHKLQGGDVKIRKETLVRSMPFVVLLYLMAFVSSAFFHSILLSLCLGFAAMFATLVIVYAVKYKPPN